jgi:hypothetical protein
MSVRLPDDDVAFYLAAATQLPPRERPEFQERVAAILRAHPDPGSGTVNAAVRTVLHGAAGGIAGAAAVGRSVALGALGKAVYCGHGVDTKPR